MRSVDFGRTGLRVSCIAFGGIPIQRLTEAEAIRVVRHAFERGITFFDTANSYTTSEERIGKALEGCRDRVVFATKTGARDRSTALEHLHLSVMRLRTDFIDLWQFHGVSSLEEYEQVLGPGGAMEAAQEALQMGKVRHIGITSHSLPIALKAIESGYFESVQFPFNFVATEAADRLVDLAEKHHVGFIAMKPFGGGMLQNAHLVIKYLLQYPNVVPDPGFETTAEIDEVVQIAEDPSPLTADDMREIERVRREVGTRFCHRCQYCEPCPQGVPISLMMNLPSFWKRFPRETFFGVWLAEGVARARECAQCGECERKCPYDLPIREMLVESIAFYERCKAGAM